MISLNIKALLRVLRWNGKGVGARVERVEKVIKKSVCLSLSQFARCVFFYYCVLLYYLAIAWIALFVRDVGGTKNLEKGIWLLSRDEKQKRVGEKKNNYRKE